MYVSFCNEKNVVIYKNLSGHSMCSLVGVRGEMVIKRILILSISLNGSIHNLVCILDCSGFARKLMSRLKSRQA